MEQVTKIIFDLDGVLVSERPYWTIANATVTSLLDALKVATTPLHSAVGDGVIPYTQIDALNGRGVNSNWDLTHLILSVAMSIAFAKQPPQQQAALAETLEILGDGIFEKWAEWGSGWTKIECLNDEIDQMLNRFWAMLGEKQGYAVVEALSAFLTKESPALASLWQNKKFWSHHQQLFQDTQLRLTLPATPVVDPVALQKCFARMSKKRVSFGVATGRLKPEAIGALEALGIASHFSPQSIITYDNVLEVETKTKQTNLGKPHPYIVLQAAYPDYGADQLFRSDFIGQLRPWLIYVGDAGSDLLAAKAAGAEAHMLLTGCASASSIPRRREHFTKLGATTVYADVLEFFNQMESKIP